MITIQKVTKQVVDEMAKADISHLPAKSQQIVKTELAKTRAFLEKINSKKKGTKNV